LLPGLEVRVNDINYKNTVMLHCSKHYLCLCVLVIACSWSQPSSSF